VEILGNGKWRTIVGLSTLYFWAMGFVTISGIVYALPNWRWAFLAVSLPTLLFANYAYLIPESPMWLISQGRVHQAQDILNDAARTNGLPAVRNLSGILKKIQVSILRIFILAEFSSKIFWPFLWQFCT
jgi:MFS family permease